MKRLWAYLAQQSVPSGDARTNEGAGAEAVGVRGRPFDLDGHLTPSFFQAPNPAAAPALEDDESIDIAGFSEDDEGDGDAYPAESGGDDDGDEDEERDEDGGDLSDLSSGEEAMLQNELQLVTRELAFIHNLRSPLPPTVVRAVPAPPQPSNGMGFAKRRRSGSRQGLESPLLTPPPIALTASGHLEPEWHYFSPLPAVFPLPTTVAHHQVSAILLLQPC
jgi:hypothetical protein